MTSAHQSNPCEAELLPPPRLTAAELSELAATVRAQPGVNADASESVAAALEALSRQRADRPLARRFAIALAWYAYRWGRAALGWAEGTRQLPLPASPAATAAAQVAKRSPGASARLTSEDVRQALVAVEFGEGLLPDTCDMLIRRGWVEWVDYVSGTPIHETSARSLLRMTQEGRSRLNASQAASA
jgi:hypothetical protein